MINSQENKAIYRAVEPNFSRSQPQKSVNKSGLNTTQDSKIVDKPSTSKSCRSPFAIEDPLEGKTIGDNNRYLLQALLVQEGMNQVYQALDTKFEDRIVAIKVMINYSAASSKHLIKNFMGEIEAISRLEHPNIIKILDFGVTPDDTPFYGSPFYVMEYFAGKTLQNLFTKNKILPLASLLNIIYQVCAGLKQAHQQGIVHRDLNPDTIFLVAGDAFGEIIKIIDFGIVKNLSSDDKNHTQSTQVGSLSGTYRYASPEQCRGLPDIDQRSYVYSLGVILYEAICGHNPYILGDDFRPSPSDWIASHLKVIPKPLKEQAGCENIEDELATIVMKCLAKSPQDRFSDLGELQNAIANNLSVRMGVNDHAQTDKTIQPDTKIQPDTTIQPDTKTQPDTTIQPDTKIQPDTIIINDLEENSLYLKTEAELKQTTYKTVVETIKTISNNFPRNFTFSSSKKKLSLGLLATISAVFMGIATGTGKYLLSKPYKKKLQNKAEKISQNQFQSIPPAITPNKNDYSVLLKNMETQYQQGNYQDCYQSGIDNYDQDDIEIKEWIGKCGLEAAKIKGEAYSYSSAISIAQKIPNTVSNYQEVQDSINTWSGKILDHATTVYKEEGKLEEAVKITEHIPEISNLTATLPELISQWQQETEKYQAIIDNAQNLLNQAQWDAAKQEVEKIPTDFDFWRQQAQPILDKANQQINAIAAAEQRRREQAAAEQPPREQAAAEQPPREQAEDPLRERLNNTPLLEDDSLRERLHNHGLFF